MEPKPDFALYQFGKDIYIGNADDLWDKIEPIFVDPNKSVIVLDMENVRVCDSYGLRLLINCQRRAEVNHKRMVLLKPDRLIREMLANTRLDSVFSIVETLDGIQ
jgi:anti-anti-sigma factor